ERLRTGRDVLEHPAQRGRRRSTDHDTVHLRGGGPDRRIGVVAVAAAGAPTVPVLVERFVHDSIAVIVHAVAGFSRSGVDRGVAIVAIAATEADPVVVGIGAQEVSMHLLLPDEHAVADPYRHPFGKRSTLRGRGDP